MTKKVPLHNNIETETIKHDTIFQAMTELINSAKTTQQNLIAREKVIAEKLNNAELFINKHLEQIQSTVNLFQTTINQARAYELANALKTLQEDERKQFTALQDSAKEVKNIGQAIKSTIENLSEQTHKNIATALNNLNPNEFQRLVTKSCEEVKTIANSSAQQISTVSRWFNVKNILTVTILSFIVATFTVLYVNDEWPWEEHKIAEEQRMIGKAVLNIWSQINPVDQQRILSGME